MVIGAGDGPPSPGAETGQGVIRKHHPAENSRSSFELWFMPPWGKLKASKKQETHVWIRRRLLGHEAELCCCLGVSQAEEPVLLGQ